MKFVLKETLHARLLQRVMQTLEVNHQAGREMKLLQIQNFDRSKKLQTFALN